MSADLLAPHGASLGQMLRPWVCKESQNMWTSLHLEPSLYTPSFVEEKSGSSGRICCARFGPAELLYCRPAAMPDDWSFSARCLDKSGACEINEPTKGQCSELHPRSAIPFAVTGPSVLQSSQQTQPARVSDNLPILPDSRGAGLTVLSQTDPSRRATSSS